MAAYRRRLLLALCVNCGAATWGAGAWGAAIESAATGGAALESAASGGVDLNVPPAPFRAPFLPASDSEILQDVPSVADPAVVTMRNLRAMFDKSPTNLAAAIQLADSYVDYGRQIGDAHYAGYAEAVIAPWTTAAEPPAAALVADAAVLQYRHQFTEARDLLQRALRINPRDAQAWLMLATLDMVQGDYVAAGKDCVAVTTHAGFALGLACSGNLHSYTGQARQSVTLLRQAQDAGPQGSAAYRAWIEGLIAETAERLGDWSLAETHHRAALKILPRDNFLLVAYADFLLDRERPREVLTLLADHTQSDTAFLRLALAQSALGSPLVPQYTWIMAARFEAQKARGSDFFGREQARFALQLEHDPQAALELALRNWQAQREPWDTRLLLQAALAAGEPRAAAEALDFLDKTRLEDPRIESLARELRSRLQTPLGARN